MGVTAGYPGPYATWASTYPSGHPGAGVPDGPGGPLRATNACAAVIKGALINCAPLALIANELVDGIPKGKNIFTVTPYTVTTAFTVMYADPVGPIVFMANSANDAVTGNPANDVVTAKLALIARELLTGILNGKNCILINMSWYIKVTRFKYVSCN